MSPARSTMGRTVTPGLFRSTRNWLNPSWRLAPSPVRTAEAGIERRPGVGTPLGRDAGAVRSDEVAHLVPPARDAGGQGSGLEAQQVHGRWRDDMSMILDS